MHTYNDIDDDKDDDIDDDNDDAQRIESLCVLLQTVPGVTYIATKGAFYIMIRLTVDDALDASDFASFPLEHVNVDGNTLMVVPGYRFYATPCRGLE